MQIESGIHLLPQVVTALRAIPELAEPFDVDEAQARLMPQGLVLVAMQDNQPIGFKMGYDRFRDGSFYSWLGGVVPDHRGSGAARALLEAQERWVADQGYSGIYVKTRNQFIGMRIMLAKHGYEIVGVTAHKAVAQNRLLHYKELRSAH